MATATPRRRPVVRLLLVLLTALIAACGPARPGAGASPGARLYAVNCSGCHGAAGTGVRGMQPPLAGTPVPNGEPDVLLAWVMFGHRPAVLPRGIYAGVMPQFAFLTDADLAALLSWVRASFGNHAEPVTPQMVAAARLAHPRS
ncbi:MAG: cytochrome c [Pseudomonadota bacterium]